MSCLWSDGARRHRTGLHHRVETLRDPWAELIGMETVGASAPQAALQKKLGFEPDRVGLSAKELGKR